MQLAETNFKSLYISVSSARNNAKQSLEETNQNVALEDLPYDFKVSTEKVFPYGHIHGLHYVISDQKQAYLLSIPQGKALCAVVDIRSESSTYGMVYSTLLSEENQRHILIPSGFVYGYSILKHDTIVRYRTKTKNALNKKYGIIFNDPKLDIDWLIPAGKKVVSKQDLKFPLFKNHRKNN